MSDQTTIKATFNLPSKENFWLIEVTGVNRKKFCGKNGELLKKYTDHFCTTFDDTYNRVNNAVLERKFILCSLDLKEGSEPNFTYNKIRQFTISPKEISYQLDFGWGNEIYGKTLDEVKRKIQDKLEGCKKHIEMANTSEKAIGKLLDEFNAYLKTSTDKS